MNLIVFLCNGPSCLLQIVEARLRSFDSAGTRIRRLMVERIAAVLTRLRTFELIEGGRGSTPDGSSPIDSSKLGLSPEGRAGEGTLAVVSDDGDRRSGRVSHADEDTENLDQSASVALEAVEGSLDIIRHSSTSDGEQSVSSDDGGNSHSGREKSLHDVEEDSSIGGESEAGIKQGATEVTRWLRFRTTDLVAFIGAALQAGDIHAASVAWRRHSRTNRGSQSVGAGRSAERREVGEGSEGQRVVAALPDQLAGLPASAPLAPLRAWLRDEVFPALDVSAAMAVRGSTLCRWVTRGGSSMTSDL